jgi:hypothetical protein
VSIFSKLFKGGGQPGDPNDPPREDEEEDDSPVISVGAISDDEVSDEALLEHVEEDDEDDEDENTVVQGPGLAAARKSLGKRSDLTPPPPRIPPSGAGGPPGQIDGWRDMHAPSPPSLRASAREKSPTGHTPPRDRTPQPQPPPRLSGARTPSKVLYAGTPFERIVEEEREAAQGKAPSRRPPPPTKPARAKDLDTATEESELPEAHAEEVDAELDAIFDDVTTASLADAKKRLEAQRQSERARVEHADAMAARELFIEVSELHLRQAKEALLALREGRDARAAIGPAIAAVQVVLEGSRTIGEATMSDPLDALLRDLKQAEQADDVSPSVRESILASWQALPLPKEHLDLGAEHERREAIIVRSLLGQVPDLEKIGVDKIYAAGLGNLETLVAANAEDIAVTTGLEQSTTASIVARVAEHTSDFGASVACVDRERVRSRLEALLRTLRHEHEAFERASRSWTDESFAEKRRRRAERSRVLRQIDVALAIVGEVDRMEELERLPVHRRIERLDGLVRDAAVFGGGR